LEGVLTIDHQYVEILRRLIAGDERELVRLQDQFEASGCYDIALRSGIQRHLKLLRAEMRFQLGEPEPTLH
jgi:hypothetical protein